MTERYRRVVTDEVVGSIGVRFFRRRAQTIADEFNAKPDPRPVQYVAQPRGWFRWEVVALQAVLEPVDVDEFERRVAKARAEFDLDRLNPSA